MECHPTSPVIGARKISKEEHELLLITGARLVQWTTLPRDGSVV
ncbi:MAG: hypothetical protein ACRDTT_10005 [Pseudonocardiaceae bacterium]